MAESKALWGEVAPADLAVICDDCFNRSSSRHRPTSRGSTMTLRSGDTLHRQVVRHEDGTEEVISERIETQEGRTDPAVLT